MKNLSRALLFLLLLLFAFFSCNKDEKILPKEVTSSLSDSSQLETRSSGCTITADYWIICDGAAQPYDWEVNIQYKDPTTGTTKYKLLNSLNTSVTFDAGLVIGGPEITMSAEIVYLKDGNPVPMNPRLVVGLQSSSESTLYYIECNTHTQDAATWNNYGYRSAEFNASCSFLDENQSGNFVYPCGTTKLSYPPYGYGS